MRQVDAPAEVERPGSAASALKFSPSTGSKEIKMNKIKVAMAVVMLVVASPAFAQSSRHALSRLANQHSAAAASDAVIVGGQYIGQEPDPYVRAELRRNYNGYLGDN
jgi:hypothetical protein